MFFNASFSSTKSIKSQVIRFLIVGIVLMTIVISLVTTKGVNLQSRQLMLNNAYQITEGLAAQVVFAVLSGDPQNADEAMKQVLGFQSVMGARLSLTDDTTYSTIGKFSSSLQGSQAQSQDTQIVLEKENYWLIKTPIKVTNPSNDKNELELEFELENEADNGSESIIGYAGVIYSKEHLKEAQFRVALLISLVSFFSVIIIAAILSSGLHKLFMPLARLSDTMEEAKNSGKYILAHIEGAKEIQNMASSYNLMMEVLKQQDNDLKSHRDQLEKEVELRTAELISARDEALSASQHKSEFMANMSHELRTPIQSIIGYGELVVEELEVEGNFELIDDMDKISRNSQRLLSMINSLLDLAKVEAGKTELYSNEIILDDLQANLVDTIKPLAHKNNNAFYIENNATINSIQLDKEKLEQILLNLLSNACKFTENGQVSLAIRNNELFIYFVITDTGIGLSEDDVLYIFDEFRQVDSGQSRKFSGTGLGLAISKKFAELMQGRITVESKQGEGSTFTLILPIADQ